MNRYSFGGARTNLAKVPGISPAFYPRYFSFEKDTISTNLPTF